jgi:hypothetical protein
MPPEPWRSFLADIDAEAKHELAVHCIGGFAVSLPNPPRGSVSWLGKKRS